MATFNGPDRAPDGVLAAADRCAVTSRFNKECERRGRGRRFGEETLSQKILMHSHSSLRSSQPSSRTQLLVCVLVITVQANSSNARIATDTEQRKRSGKLKRSMSMFS